MSDLINMTNDEIRPKCPKCSGEQFAATAQDFVQRAEYKIGMIICTDIKCQTVIGTLPLNQMFDMS